MLADSNDVNSCNFQEALFPARLLAGQDIDIWNPEAHQIKRQAGTTAPERESFANLLKESRGCVHQPFKLVTGAAVCPCSLHILEFKNLGRAFGILILPFWGGSE